MSRFLEYGVFVPADKPKDSLSSSDSKPGTAASAGQWARVAGKWVKIGAEGLPAQASLASISQTGTASASASSGPRDHDDGSPVSRKAGSPATDKSGGRGGVAGLVSDAATVLPSAGSWETSATPRSDGSSSGSAAEAGEERRTLYAGGGGGTENIANSRDGDDENARGFSRRLSSSSTSSLRRQGSDAAGAQDGDGDNVEGAGGGGGGRLRKRQSGSSGSSGNGLAVCATDHDRTNSGLAVHSRSSMDSAYSDEANGVSDNIGVRSVDMAGDGDEGTLSGVFGSSSSAACVGERAPDRDGKSRSKKKVEGHRRAGSGSSNAANSPREIAASRAGDADDDTAEVVPVETRDVACQWDGSEMGDADEEEDDYLQVELPDTPDCNALTAVLHLYDHARLENKRTGVVTSRSGWGVDENIENWDGVYLDTDDRVVALDVDGDPENRQAVLIGPLPVELAEMDHLEQLTMRRHRFKGRIPAELGKLDRLTHLNLSNCRLIGFIPPELAELANLVVLNLSWNFLSGDLPAELGKLSKLEELLVNSNAFSGAIPPEFGKLRKLQRLNAGHNIGLSGTLPPEMCRMSQLALLDLRHNKITGKIPPLFGRLTNLQQLWLQDNLLTDDIPAELARLPKLQMLHLANNKLSGSIPMALRGHPRYRAFKILPGNVALGERVAPNEKEIEAASRRAPSMNAMEHASAAHAQAQQQALLKAQQRRDSSSMLSPQTATSEDQRSKTAGSALDASGIQVGQHVAEDGTKRRSAGRGSMSRRLRGIKRIMGKKITPPSSPFNRNHSSTEDSSKSVSPTPSSNAFMSNSSVNNGMMGVGDDAHHRRTSSSGAFSPRSDLASSEAGLVVSQGKVFLGSGSPPPGVSAVQGAAGIDEVDGSPNPTASLSTTGNGASDNASPSSHEGRSGSSDATGTSATIHVA